MSQNPDFSLPPLTDTASGPRRRSVQCVGHAPTLMDAAQIAPIRDFLLGGEAGR